MLLNENVKSTIISKELSDISKNETILAREKNLNIFKKLLKLVSTFF